MRLPISITCLIALSGCMSTLQMYPGSPRPESETAKIALVGQGGRVWVRGIDGHQLNMAERDAAIAHVLPGTHTFDVEYRWGGVFTPGTVSEKVPVRLEVAAGNLYVLHYLMQGEQVAFRFQNYGPGFPEPCFPIAAGTGGPSSPQALECLGKHRP